MNRSGVILFVLFSVLVFTLSSCDTTDNVDAPDYFVKYFGTAGDQEGVDLVVNPDGTVLLYGNTTLPGETKSKLYLAKCDSDGNLLWELEPFGGSLKNQARDIEVMPDGRIVMLATSESAENDNDVLLIIANEAGKELDRVLYGYAGLDEDASTVTPISDGFIVTGSTNFTIQKANPEKIDERDAFNFRFRNDLTPYGNTWNERIGPGIYDAGIKVIEIAPGQFYFFGYTNDKPPGQSVVNFNYWIFPINNVGNGSFGTGEEIYAGDPLVNERLSSVTVSPVQSGEGYLLTGIRTDASGNNSIYVTKLRKDLNFSGGESDQVFQFPPLALSTDLENLGQLTSARTSVIASILSGFLIVSSENTTSNENFYLTKMTNNGENAWVQPKGFIFGGGGDDKIGTVAELPDGHILLIGTFSVGDDRQQKLTLIKVNKDGKFSN